MAYSIFAAEKKPASAPITMFSGRPKISSACSTVGIND